MDSLDEVVVEEARERDGVQDGAPDPDDGASAHVRRCTPVAALSIKVARGLPVFSIERYTTTLAGGYRRRLRGGRKRGCAK